MSWGYNQWDGDKIFKAGAIRRGSSSSDKVWGEINKTDVVFPYGSFVAVNADGGVKKIAAATDVIHGVVVLDIYGDGAPADKTVNVGHFSHGDEVALQAVTGQAFKRGDRVNVAATGVNAGLATKATTGVIITNYWVTEINGDVISVTLGFNQATGA